MTTKKTKSVKQKPISINELKTWLEGYSAASGPDWVPTHDQWVIIRAKIDAVIEHATTAPTPSRAVAPSNAPQYPAPYNAYNNGYNQTPYVDDDVVEVYPIAPTGSALTLPQQTLINTANPPRKDNGIANDTVGAPSPFG